VSGLVGPPSRGALRRAARGPVTTSFRHAVTLAIFASAGLGLALGVNAPDPTLTERLYAAAIAALVLLVLVRAVGALATASVEPGFDELVRSPAPEGEGQLRGVASIEQAIRFSTTSAGDFHTRLRPVLADISRHVLSERGIQLDAPVQRERAEAVLGTPTYEIVRPDAEPPQERFAPGISRREVESVVGTLRSLW
jgi:hypothetical protein